MTTAASLLTRRAFLISTVALGAASSLSGCAAISAIGDVATPLDAYELRVDSALAPRAARPLARALIIEVPEVAGALDTDRILARPNPLQAQYLPGARWIDPPATLVQGLIVRNLEDSGGLRFVGRRPVGAGGDFALIGTLSNFEAELAEDGSVTTHIRYSARLVREDDAAIIAARVFEARVPSENDAVLSTVKAFNDAAETVIPEVSRWVLSRLGARLTS